MSRQMLTVVAIILALIIGYALICNAATVPESSDESCCSLENQANKTEKIQPFPSEKEAAQSGPTMPMDQCLTRMDEMGMSDEAIAMCAEGMDMGNQMMAGQSRGMMSRSMGSMCMMGN